MARQSERLIGIVSIAILARLLTPKDFGLVGMAGSAVAIVEAFSTFGFDWAVVRLKNVNEEHYSTAWTLRFICGLIVASVLCLTAYPAALFFSQRAVMAIIFVMALNAMLGSMENIWMAEYRREMRFDQEFKQRLAAKLAGFVTAISLAILTHSYWALVIGVTATRLANTLASYWLHAGRPRWTLVRQSELFGFSAWFLFGNLAEALRSRFADLWVGRYLGSRSVGFYSMASELSALPTTELAAAINRVTFTMYSQQAGDIPGLREAYLRVSGLIWSLGLPAAVGVGVCAQWIVDILLGAQWRESAPVVQMLAAAGVIAIMAANTSYIYWALGRSKFVARLSGIGVCIFAALTLLFGRWFGLIGVAAAQVIASAIVLVINFTALFRTLELRPIEMVRRNWRILCAAVVMAGCVLLLEGHLPGGDSRYTAIMQLILLVTTGAGSYLLVLSLLWFGSGQPQGPEKDIAQLLNRLRNKVSQ